MSENVMFSNLGNKLAEEIEKKKKILQSIQEFKTKAEICHIEATNNRKLDLYFMQESSDSYKFMVANLKELILFLGGKESQFNSWYTQSEFFADSIVRNDGLEYVIRLILKNNLLEENIESIEICVNLWNRFLSPSKIREDELAESFVKWFLSEKD